MKKQKTTDFTDVINEVITCATGQQTGVIGEVVESFSTSERVMLEASATILNVVRRIERDCPFSDNAVIQEAIFKLGTVAGDLAEQWEETDSSLMMLQN